MKRISAVKPLLVTVAMTLACLGTADAATVSISFNGFCNGLDITKVKGVSLLSTVENGCAAGFGSGVGALGHIHGYEGQSYVIGENYDDGDGAYGGTEYWVISVPIVTGGTYQGWKHKSGSKLMMFGSGHYTVVSGTPNNASGKRLVAH
jgi:hypothetical protein